MCVCVYEGRQVKIDQLVSYKKQTVTPQPLWLLRRLGCRFLVSRTRFVIIKIEFRSKGCLTCQEGKRQEYLFVVKDK